MSLLPEVRECPWDKVKDAHVRCTDPGGPAVGADTAVGAHAPRVCDFQKQKLSLG